MQVQPVSAEMRRFHFFGAGRTKPVPASHRILEAILPPLVLAGCVSYANPPEQANGCIAYQGGVAGFVLFRGCATQFNDHWAVMAKHQYHLAPAERIEDPEYDLIFFRREHYRPVVSRLVLAGYCCLFAAYAASRFA